MCRVVVLLTHLTVWCNMWVCYLYVVILFCSCVCKCVIGVLMYLLMFKVCHCLSIRSLQLLIHRWPRSKAELRKAYFHSSKRRNTSHFRPAFPPTYSFPLPLLFNVEVGPMPAEATWLPTLKRGERGCFDLVCPSTLVHYLFNQPYLSFMMSVHVMLNDVCVVCMLLRGFLALTLWGTRCIVFRRLASARL